MATRAQHRRDTLLGLSTAACDLFEEQGINATMGDIAKRAGVSRRTVYRYVDYKEDLAFIHPRIWFDVLDQAIENLADRPLRERILCGSRRISEHIDLDPAPVRRAMAVAQSIPELAKGNAVVQQRWIERLTREIRGRATDRYANFRAHILAAAVMGVINAAVIDWYRGPDHLLLVDRVERGLDYIAPILDQ